MLRHSVSTQPHHHGAPTPPQLRLEGYKQHLNMLWAAHSNIHISIEDMIAEGDKVVIRFRWVGTHITVENHRRCRGGTAYAACGSAPRRWGAHFAPARTKGGLPGGNAPAEDGLETVAYCACR
ncbi:MAG: ester cyclase [Anaerolineae bacterium]